MQAVASLYGVSDLLSIGKGLGEARESVHRSPAVTEALLLHGPAFDVNPGKSIFEDPQKAREASPIGHIDGSEPPFLLLHGSADTLVSPEQSAELFRLLRERKVDVEYRLYEGADHGGLVWFRDSVIDGVVDWFKVKLGLSAAGPDAGSANL